jgi:flagellar basal body-associated protein FliL
MATEEEQVPAARNSGGSGLLLKIVAGIFLIGCIVVGYVFISSRLRKAAPPKPAETILFDLGDITTNLSDASDLKYVKTDVNLELSSKTLETEVTNDEPELRDSLISLLNNETSGQIMSDRAQLKNEAMSVLNKCLNTGQVTNIYFSDLIMQ